MRVLDLFSGLNGWTAPFTRDEVFRIDNDLKFDADAYLDITDVEQVLKIIPWQPDVIFSSPPCNAFSVMTIGRMWEYDGTPKHPRAVEGLRNVYATLKIIAMLGPKYWIMENPRAKLRALDITAGLPRVTVTQCQYGRDRMKPTDLWGKFPEGWEPRPTCRNGDPCHTPAPRGSVTGTQGGLSAEESARIPYELAEEIREALLRVL